MDIKLTWKDTGEVEHYFIYEDGKNKVGQAIMLKGFYEDKYVKVEKFVKKQVETVGAKGKTWKDIEDEQYGYGEDKYGGN